MQKRVAAAQSIQRVHRKHYAVRTTARAAEEAAAKAEEATAAKVAEYATATKVSSSGQSSRGVS